MMEGVRGVAAVKISGGLEDEIQVLVDLSKLSQLNLTLEQVAARLSAENANISGGRVDEGTVSYLVRTLNQFKNLDEIRDTIVATAGVNEKTSMPPALAPGAARAGRPVYVKDLAEVRAGHKEREAIIRIDGEEAVEIALYKEGDANAVSVAEAGLKRAEAVRKALPPDLELTTLYDQSVFIKQAINQVMRAAIEGGILALGADMWYETHPFEVGYHYTWMVGLDQEADFMGSHVEASLLAVGMDGDRFAVNADHLVGSRVVAGLQLHALEQAMAPVAGIHHRLS
jgi:HAE1 family hydrophobic/amphiphilic exporter-1